MANYRSFRLMQRFFRHLFYLLIIAITATSFFVPQPLYSQPADSEAEATFDDEEGDSSGNSAETSNAQKHIATAREKFNIKLYLDFTYEQSFGDDDETSSLRNPENETFGSHHTFLLITANPTDKMRVGFDITFNSYYELEYAVTPNLFLKGGLIFLPFGDFRYHSIYGGKVYDINNDLFPNWFTDYGIALKHNLLDTEYFQLTYEAFVSNGFQGSVDGQINMNSIGFRQDNNPDKAVGGRIKTTFFGGYTATASAMYDRWSDDGESTVNLIALECATTRGLLKIPVLNRMNLKLGYLDNKVENNTDNVEYNAFGTYAELSLKAADFLKLAFRMGEVDPNESVDNEMDQQNYNLTSIFHVNKNLELWAMYQRNEEKNVEEIDNDYLMLKAVVSF